MKRIRLWLTRRFSAGPSPEALAALHEADQRAQQARAIRLETEQGMDEIRKIIRRNELAPAVRATFMRRAS